MNDHFAKQLAQRELSSEVHARMLAAKLTAYPFNVILAAATNLWDAHDEYVAAYAAYSDAIDAHSDAKDRHYPCWWQKYPECVAELLNIHDAVFDATPSMGGNPTGERVRRHSGERYPLTRWAATAKKYHSAAKKLRAATEKFLREIAQTKQQVI